MEKLFSGKVNLQNPAKDFIIYILLLPILYISHKVSNLMIHKIKPEVLQDFQFKKIERLISREQYSEAKKAVLKS